MTRRYLALAAAIAAVAVAGSLSLNATAQNAPPPGGMVEAPRFEVDPLWPKPLPNQMLIGSAVGVGVDSRDHVFVIHRPSSLVANELLAQAQPPVSDCCRAAPPIVEFDPAGNYVKGWGGPGAGYAWPASNHGLTFDDQDNLWTGGNGDGDSHILKFTRDGQFLAQYGIAGKQADSQNTTHFGKVAKIAFNVATQEAFVADGYGNRRVAVLDMKTGQVKRFWGAYGKAPSDAPLPPYDPAKGGDAQFRGSVHCAEASRDGLVYVCDRQNDRIQVFKTDGTFVKEQRIAAGTLGAGSVWDMALSPEPGQKYLYVADGANQRVYIVDRQSLQVLSQFGGGGRQPGLFFGVHSIATDSKGNIYTTETFEGKRVQKFTFKGVGPVPRDQGVAWPKG